VFSSCPLLLSRRSTSDHMYIPLPQFT
jgi:hypothetical protein